MNGPRIAHRVFVPVERPRLDNRDEADLSGDPKECITEGSATNLELTLGALRFTESGISPLVVDALAYLHRFASTIVNRPFVSMS